MYKLIRWTKEFEVAAGKLMAYFCVVAAGYLMMYRYFVDIHKYRK